MIFITGDAAAEDDGDTTTNDNNDAAVKEVQKPGSSTGVAGWVWLGGCGWVGVGVCMCVFVCGRCV